MNFTSSLEFVFLDRSRATTKNLSAFSQGLNSCPIAICVRPKSHQFFTVGCDQQLFKWNNRKKSIDWSAKSNVNSNEKKIFHRVLFCRNEFQQPFSCGDLHPERNIIVVGTETSKIIVYDTLSSFYITTVTLQVKTGVKSVRFSPGRNFH